MAAINHRRVLLGAVAGGVAWLSWSIVINFAVLRDRYPAAQDAGLFLKEPRYPYFPAVWIVMLFLLAYLVAWLYASVRATQGAGPRTAVKVGLLVGFAAGFPVPFAMATWSPVDRIFPLLWMLELWVGAVLAAMMASWLYRE